MHNSAHPVIASLSNGLTLIVEEMPQVESVAYELAIPGGIILDSSDTVGASLLLAELTSRGAGPFDSRALSDRFDAHGIRHGESAGHDRFGYRGSLLASELPVALELVSHMVQRPSLPESEIESIRSLLLQDIASLHDNPSRWAMVELSAKYYPGPFNRPTHGSEAGIKACNLQTIRSSWGSHFAPAGSVLSIAGKCRADEVRVLVEQNFGAWRGTARSLPNFDSVVTGGRYHVQHESAQVQLVLAYPSAPFGHELYFPAKVATQVLSGGMFGRLFIEVREKRGLCYSVYASHSSTKDYGTVSAYAGTTPERAHETLEVMTRELKGLRGTVTEEELSRAKANLKTALVMGQESSGGRAGANAQEWWLDRRIRSFEEILSAINRVTARDIDSYVDAYPVDACSVLTLGSKQI